MRLVYAKGKRYRWETHALMKFLRSLTVWVKFIRHTILRERQDMAHECGPIDLPLTWSHPPV